MKSVMMSNFGVAPVTDIEEVQQPMLTSGMTLVRMHAVNINRLSKLVRDGELPAAPGMSIFGNEGSGIVQGGGRLEPGTPVIVYGGRDLGVNVDGLFREFVLVEDWRVFELPTGLSLSQGAAVSVSLLTARGALDAAGELEGGSPVLVSGAAGAVGLALMQTARANGLRPIGAVSSRTKAEKRSSPG